MASKNLASFKYMLLCDAIKDGKMKTAWKHLLSDAPVNPSCKLPTDTPLYWSILNCVDINFIKILIDKGADIYAENRHGQTALQTAVLRGKEDVIQLLVDRVAHLMESTNSLTAKKNFNFVYTAVENKRLYIVESILGFIIGINEIHKDTGLTLLHVACINNDIETIQLLIDYKANLDVKALEVDLIAQTSINKRGESKFSGKTPLFISVYNSDMKITELLLRNGANIKDEPNMLITAVQNLNNDMVQLLLNYGADVNTVNKLGETPLYSIIKNNFYLQEYITRQQYCWHSKLSNDEIKSKIVELLLNNGANPNLNNIEGNVSLLQVAIAEGYSNIVKVLLKHNANVNHTDKHDNTPLHFAINGDSTILNIILNYNPNINLANNTFMTPLHLAAMRNRHKALEKLLKNYANPNIVNKNGDTALHIICEKKSQNLKSIKLLLNHNADTNIKNQFGETSLHNACMSGYKDIVEILLKYGADVNSQDLNGKTPLHFAVRLHKSDIFELLLEHCADINIVCGENRTAYSYLLFTIKNSIDFEPSISKFKIAQKHIIKLKCAMLKISPENLSAIVNIVGYLIRKEYLRFKICVFETEGKCGEEIEKLKTIKIGYITLYSLLSLNIHNVRKFVKNELLIQTLQSDDFEITYPLYGTMIKSRFATATRRSRLLEIAMKYVIRFISERLPIICMDQIFGYLDMQDLRVFLSVFQRDLIKYK